MLLSPAHTAPIRRGSLISPSTSPEWRDSAPLEGAPSRELLRNPGPVSGPIIAPNHRPCWHLPSLERSPARLDASLTEVITSSDGAILAATLIQLLQARMRNQLRSLSILGVTQRCWSTGGPAPAAVMVPGLYKRYGRPLWFVSRTIFIKHKSFRGPLHT